MGMRETIRQAVEGAANEIEMDMVAVGNAILRNWTSPWTGRCEECGKELPRSNTHFRQYENGERVGNSTLENTCIECVLGCPCGLWEEPGEAPVPKKEKARQAKIEGSFPFKHIDTVRRQRTLPDFTDEDYAVRVPKIAAAFPDKNVTVETLKAHVYKKGGVCTFTKKGSAQICGVTAIEIVPMFRRKDDNKGYKWSLQLLCSGHEFHVIRANKTNWAKAQAS